MRKYRKQHDVRKIVKGVLTNEMLLSLTVQYDGERKISPYINIEKFKDGFAKLGFTVLTTNFYEAPPYDSLKAIIIKLF